MPDSFSSLLNLDVQTVGGNNNTWGTINTANLALLENAISGKASFAVTGGAATRTNVNVAYAFLEYTGALGSDQTETLPGITRWFFVLNKTSGAFALKFKTASQTLPVAVPQNRFTILFCDGSNVYAVESLGGPSIGDIHYNGANALASDVSNWLVCNGAAVSRTTYAALFSRIGTTWGVGDGSTTFNLPNLMDRYPRGGGTGSGAGGTIAVGTLLADQLATHTHTGSTDSQGNHTHTTNTTGAHTHTISNISTGFLGSSAVNTYVVAAGTLTTSSNGDHFHTTDSQGAHTHTVTIANAGGGSENRPLTAVVLPLIRAL